MKSVISWHSSLHGDIRSAAQCGAVPGQQPRCHQGQDGPVTWAWPCLLATINICQMWARLGQDSFPRQTPFSYTSALPKSHSVTQQDGVGQLSPTCTEQHPVRVLATLCSTSRHFWALLFLFWHLLVFNHSLLTFRQSASNSCIKVAPSVTPALIGNC